MPGKKFNVIVSDPPWSFSDKLEQSDVARGAAANYSTMTISQIKQMPVKEVAAEGALLALWVPSSLLQDGLDVMREWGFQHKQTYIWVKTKKEILGDFSKWVKKNILKSPQVTYDKSAYTGAIDSIIKSIGNTNLTNELSFGMGRLFRQTHEICLIGINSNKVYKFLANKSQRSVSFGVNLRHSAKPEHLQDSLELMFPDAKEKMEIFSRRQRKGWYCLGNESPMTKGEDILKSLNKLNLAEEKYLLPINKVISCYDEGKAEELFKMWNEISCNK